MRRTRGLELVQEEAKALLRREIRPPAPVCAAGNQNPVTILILLTSIRTYLQLDEAVSETEIGESRL